MGQSMSDVRCQPGAPDLEERDLLTQSQAGELAAIFKLLANDSRLRMLHALARAGELRVTDLAAEVSMTPQAVSNQLQRLVDRRVLAARRDGLSVRYRIVDPCVPALLDLAWCTAETSAQPDRSQVLAHG
jgi:ArsR family transcriptional regulator, lead/cadmium/zinc/bismuth-responsive transcriptional repressor